MYGIVPMHLFYVEIKMALHLSGLHTGRFLRLDILKDGGYIGVSILGGGGGGDTLELEMRLSSVEAALPQKA